MLFLHSPPPPPVVIFPGPATYPAQKVPLPDRWIPGSWGWAWRLKETVLGRPKPITLDAGIIEFTGPTESVLSRLSLRAPSLAGTNGLGVWPLGDSQLKLLRER